MKSNRFARLMLVPTTVLVLGAAACSSGSTSTDSTDATDTGAATAETIVAAGLMDDGITLDPTSAQSGTITFSATNSGTETHEIEVFEGETDPASLAIENNVAVTDGWTLVDEIEEITPGATAELATDLASGTYQVVCNLPGHFAEGMYATFTVS